MNVFVRWRPLIGAETAGGSVDHHTTAAASSPLLAVTVHRRLSPSDKPWTSASGFDAVLDSTVTNAAVFATVVLPAVPRVLAGGCCSLFAYGHSGSGKTHTVIGYDGDGNSDGDGGSGAGLCLAAAQRLFAQITERGAVEHHGPLAIGLGVFELRQKAAFDLLNGGTRCHIRQGPDGKVHIRGETEKHADGRVRVQPLVQQPCWTFSELRNALRRALARRAVGASSVHDQSSRTHAVLSLELVNADLVAARAALVDRQSELVPVGKRATDITVAEQTRAVLRSPGGTYRPRPDYAINQALIDQVTAEKEAAEARVAEAEAVVASVYERYRDAGLGGKMMFVDLAGAEYNQDSSIVSTAAAKAQTPAEKHEARQINTDLLALKEVMRAWAMRSPRRRAPYRASPLTMVLREAFTDDAATAGMVVTVSPANAHHAATLNALKYGSLMGTAAR
ncbi:hypothetical protein MY1884_001035 [Beauveria asiatica]